MVLGVSLGTVKSRILRGREALREELAGSLKSRPALAIGAENGRVMSMSCEYGLEQISAFLDRELPDGEQEKVWKHIQSCRNCAEEWESMQMARRSLQSLAAVPVPASVAMRVRVTASHELQRRWFAPVSPVSCGTRLHASVW